MSHSLWFTDYNKAYISDEKVFYSTDELPLARELEQLYPQIAAELKVLWENPDTDERNKHYGNYDAYDDKQYPSGALSRVVFKVWGLFNRRARKPFPTLYRFARTHPDITSCSMNKIIPGTILKHHYGETNAIIRIHMGLKLPKDRMSCGMEVKGEKVFWEEGRAFGFLDAHPHHVWNETDEERYIVIVDVIRPEFRNRKYFICARIIVGQLFFTVATRLFRPQTLRKIPAYLIHGITYILLLPILVAMKLNNTLGVVRI